MKTKKAKDKYVFLPFSTVRLAWSVPELHKGNINPDIIAFFLSKTQEKVTFSLQRWFSQAVLLHRLWNSQHLAENSEENYTNFLGKATRLWDLLRVDTRIPKIKPSVARKEKEEEKKKDMRRKKGGETTE